MTWLDLLSLAILLAFAGGVAFWAYEWWALQRESRELTARQDRELREADRRRQQGGGPA